MASKQSSRDRLSERLVYYKSYNSVQDIYANELSYSLIYDNIHPSKIKDALSTVRLSSLPNRFLLMRVDDYSKHSRQFHMTYEPFQKMVIINTLKKQMDAMALQGFIGNLIGLDQFICFLCCEDREGSGMKEFLLSIGEAFQSNIAASSSYSLSICVSDRCNKITDYSRMFMDMDSILKESHFKLKGSIMFLEEIQPEAAPANQKPILHEYSSELLASISRHELNQIEAVIQQIQQALLTSSVHPSRVHGEIFALIQNVESYCQRLGVPEESLTAISEAATKQIFSTNFIFDICGYFYDYCKKAMEYLSSCDNNEKALFAAPVKEYIAEHYTEALRIDEISNIVGFSSRHFTRMFLKHFGVPFTEYVNNYRIDQSKALLTETYIPIEQIALSVGFNSYSYFCTCFKRSCGMSPRAYRNQKR